jgi:hypothetical protein
MIRVLFVFTCLLIVVASAHSAEPTEIRVTDEVLVRDVIGLGLCGHPAAVHLKKSVEENFEGVVYRQIHRAVVYPTGILSSDFGAGKNSEQRAERLAGMRKGLVGATVTILSGPGKGKQAKVARVSTRRDFTAPWSRERTENIFFEFDRPLDVPGPLDIPGDAESGQVQKVFDADPQRYAGVMFERDETDRGYSGGVRVRGEHGLVTGDVPPGCYGNAALRLDGSEKVCSVTVRLYNKTAREPDGTWRVRFRAKNLSGEPVVSIADVEGLQDVNVVTISERNWKQYEFSFGIDAPEDIERWAWAWHSASLDVSGGTILLDDLEMWKEGYTNPTPFTDDYVNVLRRWRPGVIRAAYQAETMRGAILPRLKSPAFSTTPHRSFGSAEARAGQRVSIHNHFRLCEHLGCDAWFSIPGTLHVEEMEKFIEYLAAPADVGWGRMRAELGHPEPWTETLRAIHIEIGNEAWNYAGLFRFSGYNGPDYWEGLFAAAKGSPYWGDKIRLNAGSQSFNSYLSRKIISNTPNADALTIAPYMIQKYPRELHAELSGDKDLLRWTQAYCLNRVANSMDGQMEVKKEHDVDFTIYEVNYHITHGDGPVEPRNKICASLAGGINIVNTELKLMKDCGIRVQNLFNTNQFEFGHSRELSELGGAVKLWGHIADMRPDHLRIRPKALGVMVANEILSGNMVSTVHGDGEPTFTSPIDPDQTWPVLHSYATADGQDRGLVLVNLDLEGNHSVRLRFGGGVAGGTARRWMLTDADFLANNEPEKGTPRLQIRADAVADFSDGREISLPACSIVSLRWRSE